MPRPTRFLESRHTPGSLSELLMVALPLMVSFGSQSLMQFVDRVFLTWHSEAALAATMPAGLLCWTIMSLALGVANYTGTFVAQYEGAGRKERVAVVIWQAVLLSLLLGTLLASTGLLAPWLFGLIGHPADVQANEVSYYSILMAGAPLSLLMASLSSFFSGRNQTAIVMAANLGAVLVNLLLDYAFIFGNSFIPAMGIRGAAYATVLANLSGCLVLVAVLIAVNRWQSYGLFSAVRLDSELAWRMVRYGVPMGTQTFVDISGFTVFSFVVGTLGTEALAASNLAFNLNALAFIPMVGLGIGVMTLVGRRIGEGRPLLARKTVNRALGVGMIYMGSWVIAYLFIPHLLLAPFSAYAEEAQFAETQDTVVILLRFVAVYSLFDAIALVYGYAIRGAGDTVFPLAIFAVSSITLLIGPVTVITTVWGASLYACWGAATVYVTAIGIGMYWRYQQGKWQQMRVIEAEPPVESETSPACSLLAS